MQCCLTQNDSKLNVLSKKLEMVVPSREAFRSARKGKAMKLPSLTLQIFSGNPTEWPSFWETFKAAIHSEEEMKDVMKFSYLKLLLILRRRMDISGEMSLKRRFLVRRIYKEQEEKGEFHLLVREMKLFNKQFFFSNSE